MNKNKLTIVLSNFAILQPHIFLSKAACNTIQQFIYHLLNCSIHQNNNFIKKKRKNKYHTYNAHINIHILLSITEICCGQPTFGDPYCAPRGHTGLPKFRVTCDDKD